MKNQNIIKIKKVSEERYFKNDKELYLFVEKMTGSTIDSLCDIAKKADHINTQILTPLYRIMSKKTSHELLNIGCYLCELQRGMYVRTSGDYIYNLIAVEKSDDMSLNDLKNLFK